MPSLPPKRCSARNCREFVTVGQRFCEAHARTQWREESRFGDRDMFYVSTAWVKVREFILRREPLCRSCAYAGRIIPATVVDHITPRRKGGAALDEENLQPLCISCHNSKSAREQRAANGRC